jgi:hypothetical protein
MDKQEMLNKIKEILSRHDGCLTTEIMEMNISPVYAMLTQDHFSTCEEFYPDHAVVVSWLRGQEVNRVNILYVEMDEHLLEDIIDELEDYDDYIQSPESK